MMLTQRYRNISVLAEKGLGVVSVAVDVKTTDEISDEERVFIADAGLTAMSQFAGFVINMKKSIKHANETTQGA
jgi:hypothetical protein